MHIPLRELKRGSTELMTPAPLELRQRHGYEILRLIGERSDATIGIQVGESYPTLYRRKNRALAEGRWVNTAEQRGRRSLLLTSNGWKALESPRSLWLALARARLRHA